MRLRGVAKAAGLTGAVLLTLGLTACGASTAPAGTESDPLYGPDVFETRSVIGFETGEEMSCFEVDDSSGSYDALTCDWSQAPELNAKLKEEFLNRWTLVYIELDGKTSICLAKDWNGNPDKISCNSNSIER